MESSLEQHNDLKTPSPPSAPTSFMFNPTSSSSHPPPPMSSSHPPPPLEENSTDHNQPSTFEPYKIYELQDQNETFSWLCKCNVGYDGSRTIGCVCKKWGHAKCYGYPDDQDLTSVEHKCYDCRIKPRLGRYKKHTDEEIERYKKLKKKGYENIRIARALGRPVRQIQKWNLNENTNNKKQVTENTNNKKKTQYYCKRCEIYFQNGQEFGGHKAGHTKNDSRKDTNSQRKSCNNYSRKYKNNHNRNRNRNKNGNKKHGYDLRSRNKHSDTSVDKAYNSNNNNRDNSIEVLEDNDGKRKKNKKRKKVEIENKTVESENKFEDEPPNKKMKLDNNSNNNDEWEKPPPFSTWPWEETFKYLSDNIPTFNNKALKNKEGNLKKEWKDKEMTGETLEFLCKEENYNYFHSFISKALVVVKIMKAIKNQI